MAWSDRFFDQRRLTSKLKHLVLQAYVREFAFHLGSARPVIYYVDGFAGEGVYARGAVREDGSPLLIARFAEQVRASSQPFDLRCLNVEANQRRFASLQAATASYRPHIIERNYHSHFVDVLPEILTRISDAPAFFFIDPFGAKGISFQELLPIFQRSARTEVLITLQTDGMAKKAGWFRHEGSPDPSLGDRAYSLTQHLAAALNIARDKLRDGWCSSANTAEFENRMLKYYVRQLRGRLTRFNFVKPFRVIYHRQDAPTNAPVCFHLVFATQSPKGLYKMNDAMVDALRRFYREVYSDTFFPVFEEAQERQVGRVAVEREIAAKFAAKRWFTIDDVKQHCMQETDFLLRGGEYRSLVVGLATQSGSLQKLDPGQVSNSETRFRVVPAQSEGA